MTPHTWQYWTSRAPFEYVFCSILYDSAIYLFTSEFTKSLKNKSLVFFIIQCSSSWHSDTVDKLILFDNGFIIVLYLNAKLICFVFIASSISSVYEFLLFIDFFFLFLLFCLMIFPHFFVSLWKLQFFKASSIPSRSGSNLPFQFWVWACLYNTCTWSVPQVEWQSFLGALLTT